MIRALTIPLAVVALAVPAAPASAVTPKSIDVLSADTDSDGISDAYEASQKAKRKTHSSRLTMYSYDGSPTAKYYLENAWPSKIEEKW